MQSGQRASCSYSFQNTDVCFLVGQERTKLYANSNILSVSSNVFREVFDGECRDSIHPLDICFEIELNDYSLAGLTNVLRYIYGFHFEFDLGEIEETLAVGDKYEVHNFTDAVFSYVRSKLNVSNCCLVYSQLLLIPHETAGLLLQARELIEKHTKEAFEAASFSRIDEVALRRILELPLNAKAIDLLRCCSAWVDAELKRLGLPASKENRLQIFDLIKPFIRLKKIPVAEIAEIARSEEIHSLLSVSDIVQLLLQLVALEFNKNEPSSCACETNTADEYGFVVKASRPAVSEPPPKESKQSVYEELSIQVDSSRPNSNKPKCGEYTKLLVVFFAVLCWILLISMLIAELV